VITLSGFLCNLLCRKELLLIHSWESTVISRSGSFDEGEGKAGQDGDWDKLAKEN
jgi:hypothetical protein